MRVLVCGSRTWGTQDMDISPYDYSKGPQIDVQSLECQLVWATLEGLWQKPGSLTIIEGAAPGADSAAWAWVKWKRQVWADPFGYQEVDHEHYPADWKQYGKAAGYVRNKKMLTEGKPDLVLAYGYNLDNSKGTAMMIDIAEKAKIPVVKTELSKPIVENTLF